jgi:hypothetical protein
MEPAHRISQYLKGTSGKGVCFKSNGHLIVDGYIDTDWESSLDDQRLTSGYYVFFGGNLVL